MALEQGLRRMCRSIIDLERKCHSRPGKEPEQSQEILKMHKINLINFMNFCYKDQTDKIAYFTEKLSWLKMLSICFIPPSSNISQNVVPIPAVSVPTGKMLEMYIFRSHFRYTVLESLGVASGKLF